MSSTLSDEQRQDEMLVMRVVHSAVARPLKKPVTSFFFM